MKVVPYVEQPKKDKQITLKLEEDYDGVIVRAVRENGENVVGGNLIKITAEGIKIATSVAEEIGFPRTSDGSLKLLGTF